LIKDNQRPSSPPWGRRILPSFVSVPKLPQRVVRVVRTSVCGFWGLGDGHLGKEDGKQIGKQIKTKTTPNLDGTC